MDDRTVAREARRSARDQQEANDLTDAETECLRDLLKSDEAFSALATAQQNAVLVDEDCDVPTNVVKNARGAAEHLATCRELVVHERVQDALTIVALAEAIYPKRIIWGPLIDVYRAGFETVEDLQAVSQQELTATAGIPPSVAERIKAGIDNADPGASE